MRIIQAIILLAFFTTIGVFAVQNMDVITVYFLNWRLSAPFAILTVAVYSLGMLSGWTVVAFVGRSFRRVTERPPD